MTSISIDYQPSEWQCVWLYPARPNSIFKTMTWEWRRVHNEDDWLSYVDMVECDEVDQFQQEENNGPN